MCKMAKPTHRKMRFFLIALILLLPSCETIGGSVTASHARAWSGEHFRKQQTRQCANFVASCVAASGNTPLPVGYSKASAWCDWGRPVSRSQLLPGDIVIMKNTYKRGVSHVGVYVGGKNRMMVHRPTANRPVKTVLLSSYNGKIWGFRRRVNKVR